MRGTRYPRPTVLLAVVPLVCGLVSQLSVAGAQTPGAEHAPETPGGEARLAIVQAAGCRVVAVMVPPTPDPHRRLLVDNGVVVADIGDPDTAGQIIATLARPLSVRQRVALSYGSVTSPEFDVTAGQADLGCMVVSDRPFSGDDRDVLEAPFFFGGAFEQFAPGFTDPAQSADASRITAGVNGQYRLFRTHPGVWTAQLWVYGGFLAGVRSYAYCPPGEEKPICDPLDPVNIANAQTVIKEATSFEASVGLRFEFLSLNRGSDFPANLFVTIRGALFALDRTTTNKFTDPVAAVGFVVTGGPMAGTTFQAGRGSSDLYAKYGNPEGSNPWNRWKIDATVVAGAAKPLKQQLTFWDKTKNSIRFFFSVRADYDLGQQPDSVRTAVGFTFSPSAFFGAGGGILPEK